MQANQVITSQASTITAELRSQPVHSHYHLLQRSLLLKLNQTVQRQPNSNTSNKQLNVVLGAKEQGDDAPLPASKRMRLSIDTIWAYE